jgi:hypothetical protein
MYLVHFKSKDLGRIHKQGQFWHIFFTNGGVIISQDELDTWTTHFPIPLDTKIENLDPEKQIQEVLGGSLSPYPIKVDEILVTSVWRPNICLADSYRSAGGRVFLSGDAAHQNIPTGGYGMNSAVGDSFDIGWKVSTMIKGYGGPHLLDSYEHERRPVASRNIERSGVHMAVHHAYYAMIAEAGAEIATAQTDEGKRLRKKIAKHLAEHDGENKDHGIEMGYRYNGSPVIVQDQESVEPEWNPAYYIPSTWPGARAPQLLLADNETSIFDLFGPDFTLIDFSSDGDFSRHFERQAAILHIPLKVVNLPREKHARQIWDREAFLIRPDDHVAWRASIDGKIPDVESVLLTAVGQKSAFSQDDTAAGRVATAWVKERGFTATVGNVDQEKVAMLGAFQQ